MWVQTETALVNLDETFTVGKIPVRGEVGVYRLIAEPANDANSIIVLATEPEPVIDFLMYSIVRQLNVTYGRQKVLSLSQLVKDFNKA